MYEYRAVEWTSHNPDYDKEFRCRWADLIAEGWEEHVRAHWRPSLTGGACIMRRPKDEPRKQTKALTWGEFKEWVSQFVSDGVEIAYINVEGPREDKVDIDIDEDTGLGISSRCAMRRPKDEPRKWTKTEARDLAQRIAGMVTLWQLHASQWTETQLVDTILDVIQEVVTVPAPDCPEPRMWTEGEIEKLFCGWCEAEGGSRVTIDKITHCA